MNYELSQSFYFEAAHTLHREIDADSSRRIHGHTYHAEVGITGRPDAQTGMLVDLGHVRREIERVRQQLDHRLLDEVPGVGAVTLENLCSYILHELQDALPGITRVAVWRPASGDRCTLTR